MREAWDVVVVGAGPAGGLSAILASRAGARTLLVDRARFPRDKVCGCCLAEHGRGVLASAGIEAEVLAGAGRVRAAEVRIGGAAQEAARARVALPGYTTIRRSTMDESLVRVGVREGVVFRDGVGARVDGDGVVIGDCAVRARVVVVADGLASASLRGDPRFAWRARRDSLIGLGAIADGTAGEALSRVFDPGIVTMTGGRAGYVGVASLGGREVRRGPAWAIGAAVLPEAVRRTPGGGRGVVGAILESSGESSGWLEGLAFRGTPTLTRRRRAVESGGRVFVVGDATGYVEPFTGEGMSWALAGAERLHACVAAALRGTYRPGAWTRALRTLSWREQLACRGVAWVVRRPLIARGVVRALGRHEHGASWLGDRIGGWVVGGVPGLGVRWSGGGDA